MAATLPALNTELIEKKFPTSPLAQRTEQLVKRPLNLTTANLAQELDTEAKLFLEAAEKERTALKAPILEAGRALDAFFKKLEGPAEQARLACRGLIGRYQQEQRRKAAEEQRRREEEARKAAEEARRAEVNHLIEQAATTNDESLIEEAKLVEAAPIQPIVVEAPEVAKVAGASVIEKKVGTVTDPVALLKWLIERPDSIPELIEFKQGEINRKLNKGISLPGVEVAIKTETRNLGR